MITIDELFGNFKLRVLKRNFSSWKEFGIEDKAISKTWLVQSRSRDLYKGSSILDYISCSVYNGYNDILSLMKRFKGKMNDDRVPRRMMKG